MAHAFPTAFFANGIGDTILNLPALRALAQLFEKRLTLVTQAEPYRLCLEELPFRRALTFDMPRVDGARQFDVDLVVQDIGSCDLFLSLVPWSSTSLESLITKLRPALSIGFFPPNDVVLPLDFAKHSADLAFDVPRLLDSRLRLEDFAQPPVFPAAAVQRAKELRRMLPSGFYMLAIHVETLLDKMWPLEHLRTTLAEFLTGHPNYYAFVFSTAPQDVDTGVMSERIIPVCGLQRETALAFLAEADLFLGVDSCMLHVADFFRIPGVGLFGPTEPNEFGFRLGPHIHLRSKAGIASLMPADVVEALNRLVEQIRHGQQKALHEIATR